MQKYVLATVVALSSMGAAHAANSPSTAAANPSFKFTEGKYTDTASSAKVFEDFSAGGTAPKSGKAFVPESNGPYTETASSNSLVYPGSYSATGTAINPDPGGDNYLAIGSNGSMGTFNVNFGSLGVQYLSFTLGSLDNYNQLTLTFQNGTSLFLSGMGIISGNPLKNTSQFASPASFGNSGRLNIYMNGGSPLTNALFGSKQASFEIDSLAAAVPEPGTWLMMIFGFGLVGGAIRYQRRNSKIVFA